MCCVSITKQCPYDGSVNLSCSWLNSGEAANSVLTQRRGTAPNAHESKVGLVQISPLLHFGGTVEPTDTE